jgi:hypothetical protein
MINRIGTPVWLGIDELGRNLHKRHGRTSGLFRNSHDGRKFFH